MAPSMAIQNMSFRLGQSMAIVGTIKSDAADFSVNIGNNDQNIALHLNPRFDAFGDRDTIVCNSQQQGMWQQEVRPGGFCFLRGQNFKVCRNICVPDFSAPSSSCDSLYEHFCLLQIIIKLTSTEFVVTLPNGSKICFPNRLNSDKYSFFRFDGDVRIKSFEIY
uniref:Galectin n=1 Tax=Oryzias sinensis TaxID=183150 RepID=A0A8C7Y0H6_9TELE